MFFSPLFSPVENPFSLQALRSIDAEAGLILLLYVILSLIFDIRIECRGYFFNYPKFHKIAGTIIARAFFNNEALGVLWRLQ